MRPGATARDKAAAAQISEHGEAFRRGFKLVQDELGKVIVGQEPLITRLLMGFFLQGHVLLEGPPGLGKTLLLRSLAEALNLTFKRVQFTPDLMPADIVGTRILQQSSAGSEFEFEEGPVFTNLLLADEINRASPKTQSALLEAMQERQVTNAGVSRPLPKPFLVLATQNPIEMEGTYPLPEAQLDRFLFKLDVPLPQVTDLVRIAARTTGETTPTTSPTSLTTEQLMHWMQLIRLVPISRQILEFCARVTLGTHASEGGTLAQKYIRFGAGPRAMQSLVLAGKARALLVGHDSVRREDIVDVAQSCLAHRIILSFDAESEGWRASTLIEKLLQQVD